MTQEVKMYTVVCDNCKDVFEDYEGFAAWHDENDAEESAMNKEWYKDGDAHYCTDCYKINDEDELVIDKTRLDKFKRETK